MSRSVSRGNYYLLKTRKWLEAKGYTVEKIEKNVPIFIDEKDAVGCKTGRKRMIYQHRDIFGCDLIAVNAEEMIFVQGKGGESPKIAQALANLASIPWPASVPRWVVHWKPRAKEPEIHVLEGGMDDSERCPTR